MAFVNYEKKGNIVIITLNRPERLNAVGSELLTQLNSTFEKFENDSDARVAILTGNGRAYSAGSDIKDMSERHAGKEITRPDLFAMRKLTKPVIAAINGLATGIGVWSLVLHTDIRIAAASATLGMAEIARGIPVGPEFFLAQAIPFSAAMEIVLTGDFITAQRAYDIGLVNRVVPDEELMPTAMKMAERIAELSPEAVSWTRKFGVEAVEKLEGLLNLQLNLRKGIDFQAVSEDHKEAVSAFLEKRKPVYKSPKKK